MPRTRTPYPPEFRAEAVRLVRSSGKRTADIAADLGVSYWTLHTWIKQAEVDRGEREGLTTEERAELVRLRRENRVLKMEREILVKARASSTGECNAASSRLFSEVITWPSWVAPV